MTSFVKPVVFADLDETLFQTPRKLSPEQMIGSEQATESKTGKHSYMTVKQANLVQWLLAVTQLIPVTARSSESFQTVNIPFKSWAVLSNGGLILQPGGKVCENWKNHVAKQAQKHAEDLNKIAGLVSDLNPSNALRHWFVEEDGEKIYYCVKSNADTLEAQIADLDAMLVTVKSVMRAELQEYFTIHQNGNNVSFTPNVISKQAAVRYMREELGGLRDRPTFGMGDSLTDLPFMADCDFLAIPQKAQITKILGGIHA
jgi:hydroxymethylpyrimidine pyrophosphatase-like HAD family hydrolase